LIEKNAVFSCPSDEIEPLASIDFQKSIDYGMGTSGIFDWLKLKIGLN